MKAKLLLSVLLVSASFFAQVVEPKYEIKETLVKATYYYDNGTIRQEGFYKDGKVHGEWISYTKDGKRLAQGQYELGKKVGTWYFEQENSTTEVSYENNRVANVRK